MQIVLALLVDADIVVVDVFVNLSDDELNKFKLKTDRPKEVIVSKLAVISFTECDAEIDDWSDKELIPRLALVGHWTKHTKKRRYQMTEEYSRC